MRGCIGFALCVCVCVCVSVQVPKTDNFITASYFAFTLGGWTHLGMSVSPGPGVCPGLFAHLTDFVQLLMIFKYCLGMLTQKGYLIIRDRPNFVFGAKHGDFWWFRPVLFSAENVLFRFVFFRFRPKTCYFRP